MRRGLELLIGTLPRIVIGVLILASIGINFANVIGRYVFHAPIVWAEEIMIYIMVWITFAGAVLVTWRNRHLSMNMFTIMLPRRWMRLVNVGAVLAFMAVCVFVIVQSWHVVALFRSTGQLSVVAEIPMVIPHAAVLFGFVLMLLAVIVRFRFCIEGGAE